MGSWKIKQTIGEVNKDRLLKLKCSGKAPGLITCRNMVSKHAK